MNLLSPKFCFVLIVFCLVTKVSLGQDEFHRIEARISEYLKADVDPDRLGEEVNKSISAISEDGSWSTINYSSQAETNWQPLLHLNSVKQFSLSLAFKKQDATQQDQLKLYTIKALRYWLAKDPKSKNWFQNEIASPTAIGEILLLLQNTQVLPLTLKDSLINNMEQGNVVKAVGANKLDIATHMLYRACITKDKGLMDFAVQQAFIPIALSNREGLQNDYSYLQHGSQLQIASYGQVFLTGEYKVASWLLGTAYALPQEKLRILDHYLKETFLKTIRGRFIDFNTEGRGISRNDILDKINITEKGGENALLPLAIKVNPANSIVLNDAQARILQIEPPSFKVKPAHLYFWKADYTVHNRPAYSFNVRGVSKRTIRAEQGNNENLLAKFLPDGSTNIQRIGSEYFNIMPVWEWDKIPGITSRDYHSDQKLTIEWGERGVGSFIGGVTDGIYGTSVYCLDYNEVRAKKAWFFFDNEVVCLGADINSYAKEAITTTVNQAWQNGPVKAFTSNNTLFTVGSALTSNDLKWVWQDSVGYFFPSGGKLQLTNQIQTGSWAKINANRSKAKIKGKVFKLWFNHGVDPINQSYAYVVRPGVNEDDMINRFGNVQILSNTGTIQAVKNENLNIIQAVFYEPGILIDHNFSVKVDQACIILIKNISSKSPIIHVADPTQQLAKVQLILNSEWIKETEGCSIIFPQGAHKGASVSFQME